MQLVAKKSNCECISIWFAWLPRNNHRVDGWFVSWQALRLSPNDTFCRNEDFVWVCVCGLQVKALYNVIDSAYSLNDVNCWHQTKNFFPSSFYFVYVRIVYLRSKHDPFRFVYCVRVSICLFYYWVLCLFGQSKMKAAKFYLCKTISIESNVWNNNLMANFRVSSSLLLLFMVSYFSLFVFWSIIRLLQFFATAVRSWFHISLVILCISVCLLFVYANRFCKTIHFFRFFDVVLCLIFLFWAKQPSQHFKSSALGHKLHKLH